MKKKLEFLVTVAYFGTIVLIAVLAFRYLLPVVLPFLLGFAVASVFNPLISALSRLRRRWFAAAFVIIPFWGVLLFLVCKGAFLIYEEAVALLALIGETDLCAFAESLDLPFLGDSVEQWFSQSADAVLPALTEVVKTALMKLIDFLLKIPNAFLFCFATVVSSLLLSVSYPKIEPFFLRQMSARLQTEYYDVKAFLQEKILKIFRALGIMFLLDSVILLVGLLILRIPYPLLLAVLLALLDLLPYVGTSTVLVPWGLFRWLLCSDPHTGIGLLILAGVIVVVREISEPRIVGKNIGLSAFATLFSIYVGVKLCGFFGLFLFPLLFLFLKEWNDSGRLPLWRTASD